ncbi:MAG: GNAT family N-acetyltransferase [bacterium]
MEIRPVVATDRPWVTGLLTEHWGSPELVSRGRKHDGASLPGYAALLAGERVGLATYRVDADQCEMVSLNSLVERRGIGTALVTAVARRAREAGCRRLWLITTNDNLAAQDFYRNRGFTLAELHRGALAESRRLKPSIPLIGLNGIPLEDELEFAIELG